MNYFLSWIPEKLLLSQVKKKSSGTITGSPPGSCRERSNRYLKYALLKRECDEGRWSKGAPDESA